MAEIRSTIVTSSENALRVRQYQLGDDDRVVGLAVVRTFVSLGGLRTTGREAATDEFLRRGGYTGDTPPAELSEAMLNAAVLAVLP